MFKVLHAFDVSVPISAGYTFRSRAIISEQRALGWETFHVTSCKQESANSSDIIDGLVFERTQPSVLSNLPVVRQLDVIRTLTPRLIEVARREKVELIHAHSPCLIGQAAINAGRQLNIPVVYECRAFWEDAAVDTGSSREGDLRYRLTRALETKVFRNADAAICISRGLYEEIISRGVSASKLHLVGNAVKLNEFKVLIQRDIELETQLHLRDKTVLGFIGSYFAYEGIDQLIRALPIIKQKVPNIHLLLVGGGNEEANLKALVTSLNLSSLVTFVGRIPHSQVPSYASLIDCFVFPRVSLRLTELVTPLKPLESMAQGKLVVASDVNGHKELIAHNETGYLYRADHIEDLAKVTITALTHQTDKDRIVANALKFVTTERSWDANVKKYEAIYRSVTRKNN